MTEDFQGTLPSMRIVSATIKREVPEPLSHTIFKSAFGHDHAIFHNEPNIGVVGALNKLYNDNHDKADVLAYIHDDVTMLTGWTNEVLEQFRDPKVVIVGAGGATGLGVDHIYKLRYDIRQLQRIGYYSNQSDWETHGKQLKGAMDVAVVDGFFMAVRSSFLREVSAWEHFPFHFHMYDAYLCLLAARKGYKVRAVGVDCTHHGGGTSTTAEYAEFCREQGTTMEREHWEPHLFIYDHFRDLLPLRV